MTFKYKNHSTKYLSLFKDMKSKILKETGSGFVIEHIGSSAVPGLGGKGIIDISIGIKKWKDAEQVLDALKKIGFEHFHEKENNLIFSVQRPNPRNAITTFISVL